jgi:NAD(P)-dependent dehydrogenase (short-subunit alcohol dehydrogenase family)
MTTVATEPADQAGTVSLVTGATGGMGGVLATELARLGSTVAIVARDAERGEQVREQIANEIGADRIEVLTADLSTAAGVRQAADQFTARHRQLHVLVNNAGAHFRQRSLNPDGIEMHLAIDHLAGFTLTNLLLDQLRAGAPSRVVNVVSASMADTRRVKIRRIPRPVRLDPADLDDLHRVNPERGYTPFAAYARAKLLTTMCGYVLADRTRADQVTVNAVHPGLVATGIIDDISPPFVKPLLGLIRRSLLTPEQGAQASLRLAIAPQLAGITGRYFARDLESRSPEISYDRQLQQRAWTVSQTYASSIANDPS